MKYLCAFVFAMFAALSDASAQFKFNSPNKDTVLYGSKDYNSEISVELNANKTLSDKEMKANYTVALYSTKWYHFGSLASFMITADELMNNAIPMEKFALEKLNFDGSAYIKIYRKRFWFFRKTVAKSENFRIKRVGTLKGVPKSLDVIQNVLVRRAGDQSLSAVVEFKNKLPTGVNLTLVIFDKDSQKNLTTAELSGAEDLKANSTALIVLENIDLENIRFTVEVIANGKGMFGRRYKHVIFRSSPNIVQEEKIEETAETAETPAKEDAEPTADELKQAEAGTPSA